MTETENILSLLNSVPDPEVPVLNVNDLGIIRGINIISAGKSVEITITPTYSGCPAMDMIATDITITLLKSGYKDVLITKVLAPAWTTDWMSDAGRQKLKVYGIAPPGRAGRANADVLFAEPAKVQCPQCNSSNTTMISEFGSTACKALYRCNECGEPFDYFKCH